MITMKRWVRWMMAAPMLVLGFLLLCPQTGWLVQAQFGTPSFTSENLERLWSSADGSATSRLVRHDMESSSDYQVCLLDAMRPVPAPGEQSSDARIRSLWALVPRFPNEPGLYAHILRFYTLGAIRMNRDEEYRISGMKPPAKPAPTPSRPEDLAGFDKAAAEGERLDPENAYFPYMRAAGFLAAHRDDDAVQEMHKIARTTQWNDYISQEELAREHTWSQSGRHPASIEQMAADAATLLPHFASCREVARVMVYKAGQAEASGHVEEGLELRHNVMKLGSLMRCDSTTVIGNLVGIAITAIAASRVGGHPVTASTPSPATEAQRQALTQFRRQQYFTYLRRMGHPAEAEWAAMELAAGDRARTICHKGLEASPMDVHTLRPLIIHWFVDMALLANALWLLVLAGIVTMMGFRRSRRHAIVSLIAGSLLIAALGSWTWHGGWVDSLYFFTQAQSDCIEFAPPVGLKAAMAACSMAVPLLLVVVTSVAALLRRNPVRRSIAESLHTTAPILASLLLLLYAGMIVSTARLESSVQGDLHRSLLHEGRFLAERTHQVWPGK